jgi:DNA helicase-2/ATP-dependent DNA helicase PcrA
VLELDGLLRGLDAEQTTAVSAPAVPLVIVAGAGSGKTTTLTRRIAFQVARGDVPAANVLALSHTTKAAAEVAERLKGLDEGLAAVQCSTVHAAAWKVVRQFHQVVGFETCPKLVSSILPLVRTALRSAKDVKSRQVSDAELFDVVSELEWAAASGCTPETYVRTATDEGRRPPVSLEDVARLMRRFAELKLEQNVVDFADVLRLGTLILGDESSGTRVRNLWRCVVVDEFQDTDRAQSRFLDALRAGRPLWSVVGDPRQTIYSFKGADPSLLREMMREDGVLVVRLERSWRCSSEILVWANAAIGSTYGPPLKSASSGPEPVLLDAANEELELSRVVSQLSAWNRLGVPFDDMSVLFRFNAQSARLEAELSDAGIPCRVVGAPRFFERPEVVQVLRSFGAAAREDSEQDGVPLLNWAASSAGYDLESAPDGQGTVRARWESVKALVQLGARCSDLTAGGMLAEFLDLAHPTSPGGVSLSTIHAAKGLEWRAVVVYSAIEGSLPSSYALSTAQVEEERRLFYVALTRARERLAVSYAARYKFRPSEPSRFLRSLPVKLRASAPPASKSKKGGYSSSAGARGGRNTTSAKAGASSSGRSWQSSNRASASSLGGDGGSAGERASFHEQSSSVPISGLDCKKCHGRLSGFGPRESGVCSPDCLDGELRAKWDRAAAWRSSLADPAQVSDRELFRLVACGEPGPRWPASVPLPF